MNTVKIPFLALILAASAVLLPAQAPMSEAKIHELESVVAQNGQDSAALKALNEVFFSKAVDGDKGAVDRAMEITISLMQLEPTQALHQSRYGSLCAMKARDLSLPLTRLWYCQQGLESMGKAIALAPNDIDVRLTRAYTCSAMPIQLKQAETAIQDCQHVEALIAKNPERYPQSLHLQTSLLLASTLQKVGKDAEAKAIAEKIQSEAPNTPFAHQAQKLLK